MAFQMLTIIRPIAPKRISGYNDQTMQIARMGMQDLNRLPQLIATFKRLCKIARPVDSFPVPTYAHRIISRWPRKERLDVLTIQIT